MSIAPPAPPLPKTCALPPQYLQPQSEEYFVGLPFWEIDRPYDLLANVPIGEKGNNCVGCEPGSGPCPFIVVYNDGHQMGFIYPYVTVVERKSTEQVLQPNEKKTKSSVLVQVGGDTLQNDESKFKAVSETYTIEYITYEQMKLMMKQFCCYNFSSFGNWALPDYNDPITLEGYFKF